jgi:tRNA(Ile)-lysidine synthase
LLTNKLISKNIDLSKNMFIAYSGGPDSTALLHLLSTVDLNEKAKVQAIHINHNLSKHSDSWEKHCIEQCSKLNINLITESVEIKSDGDGIEAASRKARYKIFENLLNDDDQLLLGHHRDDVAETIFMRLLRGSGPDGMEGPKIKRSIGKGILIRPFLKTSKQEILEYLNQNEVEFIQDDSNLSNDFDRNFLRNRIFPLLEER